MVVEQEVRNDGCGERAVTEMAVAETAVTSARREIEMNKMEYDEVDFKQEWLDEISNEMKYVLFKAAWKDKLTTTRGGNVELDGVEMTDEVLVRSSEHRSLLDWVQGTVEASGQGITFGPSRDERRSGGVTMWGSVDDDTIGRRAARFSTENIDIWPLCLEGKMQVVRSYVVEVVEPIEEEMNKLFQENVIGTSIEMETAERSGLPWMGQSLRTRTSRSMKEWSGELILKIDAVARRKAKDP